MVFCDIQSIILFVTTIEGTLLVSKDKFDTMAFSAITALISSYSILSYNQISLIFIYLCLSVYGFCRTYFHYISVNHGPNVRSDNIRFIIYLVVALIFIYCFSRAFNERERRRYIQSKQ